MPLYDVYVQLAGRGKPDELEYVSTTAAEWGEVVAALQVLFPAMCGFSVEPAKPDAPELHDYSDRVNK